MKKLIGSIFSAGLVLMAAAACGNRPEETGPRTTDGYIVAAYIWPSCHDDSLARKYLWSEGIGEW